jgi:SAM-dependent methyltransferase
MKYKANIKFPSIKRLIFLWSNFKKYSLLRSLQYESLMEEEMKGMVLDFGGGESAEYLNRIGDNITYESVNIDQKINPTWLIEVGDKIPCEEGRYDIVMSLNTLEHIYNPFDTISEMSRVLKKGGKLIISTPFIFQLHSHPNDYLRLTTDWYRETLSKLGFTECRAVYLNFGPFSTSSSLGVSLLPRYIKRRMDLINDLIYFRLKSIIKKKSTLPVCPLGFWITATK